MITPCLVRVDKDTRKRLHQLKIEKNLKTLNNTIRYLLDRLSRPKERLRQLKPFTDIVFPDIKSPEHKEKLKEVFDELNKNV